MVHHRKSVLIHHIKLIDESGGIEERVVWMVPKTGSCPDGVRYRLAYIRPGEAKPAVLYDNHRPKGHHRHRRGSEEPYPFRGIDGLLTDFHRDVEECRANA